MYDVLHNPEHAFAHVQRYTFSVILSIMFGVRSLHVACPSLQEIYTMTKKMMALFTPGTIPPIDLFPFLKYMPERWAWWKRRILETRLLQRDIFFRLLGDCESREQRGEGNGCAIESVKQKGSEYGLTREMVGYVGGSALNGGSTTTTSYLHFFLLLMMEHPEVQVKAREELDRVVGNERLPCLDDMPNLPYIRAVIQEIHRFRPVLPLGVPRRALNDIMFGQYRIPSGSTVMVNVWGLYRDETLFDEPEKFNPDRYMVSPNGFKKDVPEHVQSEEMFKRFNLSIFGYGRRVCPGQHLAVNSISLSVARMLWGFELVEALKCASDGATTSERADSMYFSSTASNDPLPFKSTIRPRSQRHAETINLSYLQCSETFKRYEREAPPLDKEVPSVHVQA